jgi:hypothetical protein
MVSGRAHQREGIRRLTADHRLDRLNRCASGQQRRVI